LILAKKRRKRTVRWFLTAATANAWSLRQLYSSRLLAEYGRHGNLSDRGVQQGLQPELKSSFAVAAMEKAGIYDKMKDNFVRGENISATLVRPMLNRGLGYDDGLPAERWRPLRLLRPRLPVRVSPINLYQSFSALAWHQHAVTSLQ